MNYVPNSGNTSGLLTLTDGTNAANLELQGGYTLANFVIANDGDGGTLLIDPKVDTQSFGNASASSGTSPEASDPVVDQGAVTVNAGPIAVSDGGILPLGGTVDNTGSIALDSTGDQTELKILPHPGSLGDDHLAEHFLREGKAAAGLHHPHIVPVYDAGQDGPYHYLAAAFIPPAAPSPRRLPEARWSSAAPPKWYGNWPRRWRMPTPEASSTVTSSRPTCCSTSKARRTWLTSGWRAAPRRAAEVDTRKGRCWAHRRTWLPNRPQGRHGEPLPRLRPVYARRGPVRTVDRARPVQRAAGHCPVQRDPSRAGAAAQAQSSGAAGAGSHLSEGVWPSGPRTAMPAVPELADDLRRWREGLPVQARPVVLAEHCAWLKRKPRLAALWR